MFAMPREVPHLAIEDLFGPPVRTRASISPDGTRIAYLAPWRDRLNVWVESVDSEAEARCVTADGNRSVLTYHWTDDPRWLLYEQDGDGDENWHIHRVDLDDPDAEAVDLTPFPGARVISFEPLVTRPGKAILSLNRRKLTEFDLYELDIATGDLTMLAENPGRITGWLCTPSGDLYAQTLTADGDIELSRWDAGTGRRTRSPPSTAPTTRWASSRTCAPRTAPGCGSAPTGTATGPGRRGSIWPPVRRPWWTATRSSTWTRAPPSSPRCRRRSSATGPPES
ncbi:hypothetical protein ACFQ2Y_09390 [Streptomyces malaysiensis subsp. malaysiensis]